MAEEIPNEQTPEIVPDPVFTVDDSTKQFFEEYVGPGKKYANVGELAKAYANADRHLAEVTKDAGIFKTEADHLKELLMENLVNQPNNEPNPNTPPTNEAPSGQPPANEAPSKEPGEVDIKALVKEALEERTTEDRRRDNARITEEASIKKFGTKEDAVKAIAAKAEELGLSPQWIANLAFESPKAYFTTMGFNPDEIVKSNNTPAPNSEVNPQVKADTTPGVKPNTYRYFQEIRKTNPARYRSQEIQQAILKAAAENPDFYS